MTLVVDASFVVSACSAADGFDPIADELIAPHLLWSEVRSTLHRSVWRGVISTQAGEHAMRRLDQAPVRPSLPSKLGATAWSIADALGWAKTYDAEYLAVARLSDCALLSLDRRMVRGAELLGIGVADV